MLWFVVVLWARPLLSDEAVHFGRDVLPLLSDRCFSCHGPDEVHREADLRLDRPDDWLGSGEDALVVPMDADRSELIARIDSDDPDLQMPPPTSGKALTAEERDLLRAWVQAGARWSRHWAFEPPRRPIVPGVGHPIDQFIRRRHAAEGIAASPRAADHVLLRRLSLDLTGLPPKPTTLAALHAADDPEAFWDREIERLLTSPHHAERMAMWWLDAARYADTDGYQGDATRTNWAWRDWVVKAFASNMPFDQFTIEQFAGDLLPEPTDGQILATCFHRNHMTNGEGGRHPEESRIDYVMDRVNTTGTVWLGLTLGCAQCHAHKFDPISHEDYYRLFACFNSVDEDGRAGSAAKPFFKYQSPHAALAVNESQRLVETWQARLAEVRRRAEQEFEPWLDQAIRRTRDGFVAWHPLQPQRVTSAEGTQFKIEAGAIVQTWGPFPRQDDYRISAPSPVRRITGVRLEVLPHPSHTSGKLSRGQSGEFILTNFKVQVRKRGHAQLTDLEFDSAISDKEKSVSGRNYGKIRDTLDDDPRNGWTTVEKDSPGPRVGVFALSEPLFLAEDETLEVVMLHRSTRGNANIGRFRLSVTDQPGEAVRTLRAMPLAELADAQPATAKQVDAKLRQRLLAQFLVDHAEFQKTDSTHRQALRQLQEAQKASGQLNVMVLRERDEPRITHVLERGVWDQHGVVVEPAIPSALTDDDTSLSTRLDLAAWLVSRKNPLTARVIVNHLWGIVFGTGLVRTPDDFGLQGERPTHPELLDWLAVEFMEHDWDIRHMLRLMVRSATYQQSSRMTAALKERDPENKWWARAARYRLPSWMIRDASLQASNLLNPMVGGPPVRPYQPAGVWAEIFMGRFRYEPSLGALQYRRTLYAFWRRSSAPTFLFDAAQRRVCEVRARRTNTPLQALTLLNDRTQMMAAVTLGRRALQEAPQERTTYLYQRVLSRPPTVGETNVVERQWQQLADHYAAEPEQAAQLLATFDVVEQERSGELAAALIVASMLLNLDEAITRE